MEWEELKEKAHSLPLRPGVYLMSNEANEVIYVGKAKVLRNRVSQYFVDSSQHSSKTRLMVSKIHTFDVIVADSEFEALVLECALIKRHKPRYNILLKDDKGYPYVRLDPKELYPRFSLVGRSAMDGARYFGPFAGRRETRGMLDALCHALKLPTCNKKFPRDIGKERPCLNFHLGKCDGYCQKEVPRSQHHKRMEEATEILGGKFRQVEETLTAEMMEAAENLAFEKAAQMRDRLQAISLFGKKQKVLRAQLIDTDVFGMYADELRCAISVLHFQEGELSGKDTMFFGLEDALEGDMLPAFLKQYYHESHVAPKEVLLPTEIEEESSIARLLSEQKGERVYLITPQRGAKMELIALATANAKEECVRSSTKEERQNKLLVLLGELLKLEKVPERIESFDISNTGASNIVAAMAVFQDGKPAKQQYRYFKLRDLSGPDDYASMAQVLERRFRRGQSEEDSFAEKLPDLLLIDGGKEHAAIGRDAVANAGLTIPVFGMVKDDRHRTRALIHPDGEEIGLTAVPALFALIGQIQEETHNAAIGFHHKQRTKSSLASKLEEIPGVGESRRKKLMSQFKSIKAIREASLGDLEELLPKKTALAVYTYFNEEGQ